MNGQADVVRYLRGALFVLLVTNAMATGRIIYVDTDAIAIFDGSSWAYGYRTLQDAIAEVQAGDEIRVAQGIYRPDRRTTGGGRIGEITVSGNKAATFELINDVTFKGGYAGYGESDPDARDIDLYETILSGDLYGNDVDINNPEDLREDPSRSENSFHVVISKGNSVIDGFIITGGNANESFRSTNNDRGGGLLISGLLDTLQITNCTFTGNSALSSGGGIYNSQGELSLTNCTFTENSARAGGGIYNQYGSPILTNCVFRGNSIRDQGGGMCNILKSSSGESPILRNCLFIGNRTNFRGGGIYNLSCEPVLINCTFTGNSAGEGNALYCKSEHERNTVRLFNCILRDGGDEIRISERPIMNINIFYSNIQNGWPGEGNIDADPIFVSLEGPDGITGTKDDDLRLAPLSSCIDAGDPNYVSGPNETAFGGDPRIVSDRVDMGAYEFQGILHVDDDALDVGRKFRELAGTEYYPFRKIQDAINIAKDGYTVGVQSGVYGKIDFLGKPITVKGADGTAVIEAPMVDSREGGGDAVTFHTGEGPDSVLKNFIIRNSGMAVSLNSRSSPTISNLTIVDNDFGIAAYENSTPDIRNCIFWNNTDGNLFQCEVRYSCVEGGAPGEGNISVEPLFVDAADGDYHLKSEGWRWSSYTETWTYDNVTSRSVDAGDPVSPLGEELMSWERDPDNLFGLNRRINMGTFGGTWQASMPPTDLVLPEYETIPPEPNPAQWAPDGAPAEVKSGDRSSVRMEAVKARDVSDWVEYFFECTSQPDFSSDWQISPTYSVSTGRSGQGHYFRIKARDLYANETAWSEELPAN